MRRASFILFLLVFVVAGCDLVALSDTPQPSMEYETISPMSKQCYSAGSTITGNPDYNDGATEGHIKTIVSCAGPSHYAESSFTVDPSLFVGATTTITMKVTRKSGATENYSDSSTYFDPDPVANTTIRRTVTTDNMGAECQYFGDDLVPGTCPDVIEITGKHEFYMYGSSSPDYTKTTNLKIDYD